jgi:hypothetical protein
VETYLFSRLTQVWGAELKRWPFFPFDTVETELKAVGRSSLRADLALKHGREIVAIGEIKSDRGSGIARIDRLAQVARYCRAFDARWGFLLGWGQLVLLDTLRPVPLPSQIVLNVSFPRLAMLDASDSELVDALHYIGSNMNQFSEQPIAPDFYRSSFSSTDNRYSVDILSIPSRSMAELPATLAELADRIGVEVQEQVSSPIALVVALTKLLRAGETSRVTTGQVENVNRLMAGEAVELFSDRVVFGKLVPFESSAPDLHALGQLLLKSTGPGLVVAGLVYGHGALAIAVVVSGLGMVILKETKAGQELDQAIAQWISQLRI